MSGKGGPPEMVEVSGYNSGTCMIRRVMLLTV